MITGNTRGQQGTGVGDSELSEIAIAIERQPSCHVMQSMLDKRIETLLEQSRDNELTNTINQENSGNAANIIRRAAEKNSEFVRLSLKGFEVKNSLFTVPILMEFNKDIPESQVESTLSNIERSWNSTENWIDRSHNVERTVILPALFKFNDLARIPLSLIRKGTINLALKGNRGGACSHPFIRRNGTLRRSRTFLRYLVGGHVFREHHPDKDTGKKFCVRLEHMLKSALERDTRLDCSVNVSYTGSFHEPLYTNMWLYQIRRLDQIATAVRSKKINGDSSKVVISLHGNRCNFDLKVAFYEGGNLLDERKYLLHTRPAENGDRCTTRIVSQMEAIGMMATCKEETTSQVALSMMRGESDHCYTDIASIPI